MDSSANSTQMRKVEKGIRYKYSQIHNICDIGEANIRNVL